MLDGHFFRNWLYIIIIELVPFLIHTRLNECVVMTTVELTFMHQNRLKMVPVDYKLIALRKGQLPLTAVILLLREDSFKVQDVTKLKLIVVFDHSVMLHIVIEPI